MPDTTIPAQTLESLIEQLHAANLPVSERFPGERAKRQPVHTVYGGAHLFKADSTVKLGAVALRALEDYAPDAATLASALGFDRRLAERIYPRVVEKLTREPVEDFRLDFEDGFGNRPDEEEDRFAQSAADEVAAGFAAGSLPPAIGIRIKPLNEELKHRSVRTFDLFLTRLLEKTGGVLPPNFVVTLPKITAPEQAGTLAHVCDAFELWRDIQKGSINFELMIETTQSVFAPDGSVALPRLIAEGKGRIVAAHFGTYDYTASCSITAAHQHMLHPACDFAKNVMQVALAGTGVWLSDGASNLMPVGPHRAKAGSALTPQQKKENAEVVHRVWRGHVEQIRHSLVTGFYQGWDLHPAQFVTRYATVYAFFLEGLDAASERLRNFIQKAALATMVGEVFDDAATGQGLLNYFLRAMNCGAIDEQEAVQLSGLSVDELRSKSFVRIMAGRRG
jgi:citrate lyase beta subunit